MVQVIGAVAIGTVSILNVFRDMRRDGLVSKKELAEIEAKSKAFSESIRLVSKAVDKTYDLEKVALENKRFLIEQLGLVLERAADMSVETPAEEKKLERYLQQTTIIMEGITQGPQYFNSSMLEKMSIVFPEFNQSTEIGNTSSDSGAIALLGKMVANTASQRSLPRMKTIRSGGEH